MLEIISIVFSIILGFSGLIYTYISTQRSAYINQVTKLRAEWLYNLKAYISEFCGLIATNMYDDIGDLGRENIRNIRILRYKIILNLNYRDSFDKRLIELMDNIICQIEHGYIKSQKQNLEKAINIYIETTQRMLKLEWEGIKAETEKGKLSKREKQKLLSLYLY